MAHRQAVLDFWLGTVGPAGWYLAVEPIDAEISNRFSGLWDQALAGGLTEWSDTVQGTLAYLILTDQFPRNMFRGDGRSFATDPAARAAARQAIAKGFDLQAKEPERVFFYMPFEHSEDPADQDFSVEIMQSRLPETGDGFAVHARAHREVIRRFGRFPFRNAALGRVTTPAEQAFLEAGSYGALVRELEK